jgi:hypothetical protein
MESKTIVEIEDMVTTRYRLDDPDIKRNRSCTRAQRLALSSPLASGGRAATARS